MEKSSQQHPKARGPQPPFSEAEQQKPPGQESEMSPEPDFGADSYEGAGKLSGKRALITGGDSGIGRAVALAYAREGADVGISYLNEDADDRKTEQFVEEAGRKTFSVRGDISDRKHCQMLIQKTVREFGGIDILVNNAAYQRVYDDVEEIPPGDIEYTFRVNLFSMFYLCQAAIPKMAAGSAIINVASVQAYHPSPELLPYAATKGAIVTFSKGLSEAVIDRGIRVNVVAPGPVWTPLIVSTMKKEKVKKFGENYPMGRPAQPVEVSPVFVFLASQDASYITGEVVGVTGGKPLP